MEAMSKPKYSIWVYISLVLFVLNLVLMFVGMATDSPRAVFYTALGTVASGLGLLGELAGE